MNIFDWETTKAINKFKRWAKTRYEGIIESNLFRFSFCRLHFVWEYC